MDKVIQHFIDGKEYAGSNSGYYDVYNPATGKNTAKVALAGSDEVAHAVTSALSVQADWGRCSPLKRSRILRKFLTLLEDNADALALAVSTEHGKTIADAKGELARGMEIVEFALGAPQLLKGEYSQQVATDVDS